MDYYTPTVITFLIRVIEFYAQFKLMSSILNKQGKKLYFFLGIFVFTIMFEALKLTTPQYLSTPLSILLAVPILMFVFNESIYKVTGGYILIAGAVSIVDCIVSLCILKIFNLENFQQLAQRPLLLGTDCLIISLIMLLTAHVISTIRKSKTQDMSTNIKSKIFLLNAIVMLFTLTSNLVMILYYHDNKTLPIAIVIINIVALISMFLISLYNTQRGIKLVQAEEELITEKTYNKTLEHLVDGLRTFKHDYNNTLQTIYGYILTDDMPELKNFFNQILNESREITALDKLKPELFKNPSLFGLVTAKFEYARKSEVTMNLEIYGDLDNLDIKTYDFTRMFGIFLDNAIEASAGSEKKVVNLYVAERNDKVTIEISNSFSDTGLTVEEMSKKGVSSKGDNRGLGLYKVKEILKKYPKVKLETNSSNGMFLQRLIIDKVKEISLK